MLGKIEGRKRRGQQRIRWLNGITDSMDMTSEQTSEDGEGQRTWHTVVHGRDSDTTQHISNVPVFRMDTLKGN